jgi:glycosyltransferase involved in cell wall biosynthesis
MNTLRASVAMCTFNGACYLREQLDSIASQTELPYELVVCDDGSTDDTNDILSAFACKQSFDVRICVNDYRLGVSNNFSKAIEMCRGDIIFLCDQDDIWKRNKIAKVVAAFHDDPEALYAFSDAEMINESGVRLGYTLWDAVGLREKLADFNGIRQLEMLLRKSLVTGAATALRSSFGKLVLPIPPGWMHDAWIALLGSTLSRGIPISDALLYYRRHSGQACGWRSKTFWQVLRTSLSASGPESWHKVEQFAQLRRRSGLGSTAGQRFCERLHLLEEKEAHLKRRAEARSASRLSRICKVISELSTGRYARFSESSWYSVVRDLC